MYSGGETMDKEQQILDVLADDGIIWYAYLSGGLLLIGGDDKQSDVKLDTITFHALREKGKISKTSSMRQGHSFFHGPCDMYSITTD
jgi:hypothetical protein